MAEDVSGWFASRVPTGWFAGPPEVASDGEEILVTGRLPDVELAAGTSDEGRAAARSARIDRFREETRDERVRIAREAERQFRRKVAWGAMCGDETRIFTTLSVPVMTRLRMPEPGHHRHAEGGEDPGLVAAHRAPGDLAPELPLSLPGDPNPLIPGLFAEAVDARRAGRRCL